MLASVLNSQIAIESSIIVVRAFIHLREFVRMSTDLAKKLEEFEFKTNKKLHKHDKMFEAVFDTLKKVLNQESKKRNTIGFIEN